MNTPPPLPPPPPIISGAPVSNNWVERHWKWFIPCVALIGLGCIGGFVGGTFVLIEHVLKSSDAYSGAMERTQSNPAVVSSLGSPIKAGFFVGGHISVSNSSGKADLQIPISGPKGAGEIYVSADKSMGEWHYDELIVQIEATKQRIDILNTNNAN